jgi:hypothetical protein
MTLSAICGTDSRWMDCLAGAGVRVGDYSPRPSVGIAAEMVFTKQAIEVSTAEARKLDGF